MEFRFITTQDPLYPAERKLRSEVLRKPLGFPPGAEIFPFEKDSLHLVAVDNDKVVGCVLYKPEGRTGRLYQMAVYKKYQGRGIGRKLISTLEKYLKGKGVTGIYLHARKVSLSFYEQLGYKVSGGEFIEIGIPHFTMKKTL